MFWLPERRIDPELMDLPPGSLDPGEIEGALADLEVVNGYLGTVRAVLKHLAAMEAGSGGRGFTVLDVATGSADIPVAVVKWARRKRKSVFVAAVDRNPVSIDIARRKAGPYPEIALAVADALDLPFADGSFDYVLCSKTAHHFTDPEARRLIEGFLRVSRRGMIVVDLRRSWTAYFLIRVLTRLFSRNRLTRNDGPLSVLKARTPGELAALAEGNGKAAFRTARERFALIVLEGRVA